MKLEEDLAVPHEVFLDACMEVGGSVGGWVSESRGWETALARERSAACNALQPS